MSFRPLIIMVILLFFVILARAQQLPYTNQTDAGLLMGPASKAAFSAQTFHGVKIIRWKIEAGINAGVDIYPQLTILPVSAGFKWNPFNAHRISPLLGLSAGYGFGLQDRQKDELKHLGGYIFNPTLGLRVKTKSSAKLNLGIGYRQQKAVNRQNFDSNILNSFSSWPILLKEEYKLRKISLTVGISF